MPFYSNADQLYTCIGTLFDRVLTEIPAVSQGILAARMLIRLRCREPQSEIILNGRQRPIQTSFGATSQRPDLDVELAGDTLHYILLDHLSIRKAMANGELRVRGPIWKTSPLAELLRQGRAFYPQVLREQGLGPKVG
jgi:hypothetical protein